MSAAEKLDQETLDSKSLTMWKALHNAFDFLNDELFDGRLDRDSIILNCSRKNRTLGFYRFKEFGWVSAGSEQEPKAEISLNPDYMSEGVLEIYSTLVHEMCHFEQDCFGKPGKGAYHNKEWSEMMQRVGLDSFNVSDPSKKTGMRCSHKIIPNGVFAKAMEKMPEEYKLPFMGLAPPRGNKKNTGYQKWVCPMCKEVCRAKNTASIACIPCSTLEFQEFQNGNVENFNMVEFVLVGF